MAEEPKKENISQEDLADEEEIKETEEDEVRQQIIEKYGLDEIEQPDLIDQLVEEHMEIKKKLGTAIKQKRKWREEAQKKVSSKEEKSEEKSPSDIERLIDERFDQRELDISDLSDELKKEVQAYAKVQGIRIKDALNSEYIGFLKGKEEQEKKEEEASTSFKRKSQAGRDYSKMSPKDFDLTTEEGQKGFEEYKKWLKT